MLWRMLQGRTLWELMERRVDATPDALMAVDEDGRTLTFAESRAEAERAAAGLSALGIGAGDVVSWQLPTWLESMVLVAALSPPRRDAEPDAADLPRARGRLHHRPGRRAAARRARRCGGASTTRPWPTTSRRDSRRACDVLVADKALPQGDPSHAARRSAEPADADDAGALALLHVGHHGRPEGRASTPTPTIGARRRRHGRAPRRSPPTTATRWCSRSPTSAASPGCSRPRSRAARIIVIEAFDPDDDVRGARRARASRSPGAGTPFHMAYLAAPAQRTGPTPLFPTCGASPAAVRRSRRSSTTTIKAEIGGVGIVSGLRPDRGADPHDGARRTTPTTSSPTPRARPMPGVELKVGHARRQASPAPGEEGEIRAKAPQMMQGYLDASLDADAFDEDGYFRTGDLGRLDADGNVIITGRLKDIIIRKGENISRQGGRGPALHPPQGRRRRRHRPARPGRRASGCARWSQPADPAEPLGVRRDGRRSCRASG